MKVILFLHFFFHLRTHQSRNLWGRDLSWCRCVCLFLCLQPRVRQRGPTHLRERGRAEGRHPGSDPGRQAQGSARGGAGDSLNCLGPSGRCCSSVTLSSSAPTPQFIGAEFGDDVHADKASASDSSSMLSCVDRAERNSRALSLHNSITKSRSTC